MRISTRTLVAFPFAILLGAAAGIVLALSGCLPEPDGSGPPAPETPDARVIVTDDEADASPGGGGPDAGGSQGNCAVDDDYGNLGPLPGAQAAQANQPGSMGTLEFYTVTSVLDGAALPDALQIELWDNYGAFAGGPVTTGTFTIAGAETAYDTCGVCVVLYGDADPATGAVREFYLAESGTVQIESIAGNLTGSISGVSFRKLDPMTGTPIDDGCASAVGGASFDSMIVITDGGGGGGG